MLVNNVGGEKTAASMARDSGFYIDLAKFVQAYSMIVLNPNQFLKEAGEPEINQKTDFLTWDQFVKIMKACDFGFETAPTETELVVFYNYALEMGSLKDGGKKIASVKDVANAQKHYYNFVDDSAEKAEIEFLKKQDISDNRDREAKSVDAKLMSIKIKNIVTLIFMTIGVLLFTFGLASCFFDNVIAAAIGKIIPVWKSNIIGGIIFMLVGIILFAALNRIYLKTKYAYLKLRDASQTIFDRSDSAFHDTLVLKNKLNILQEDLKAVKEELADKEKTHDVAANIEKLAETNKYYKQFAGAEISFESSSPKVLNTEETLAPVKLTKDQYENVRSIGKEAIVIPNELDEETYTSQQIETEGKKQTESEPEEEKETEEVYGEFSGKLDIDKNANMDENKNLREIENDQIEAQEKAEEEEKAAEGMKDLHGLGV